MRTSFNIPKEVIEEFDETWQSEGFESRSRAVREAMQEYIEAHSRLEDFTGNVVGLIAFDYEHPKVITELHDIQHEFQDIIQTTHHTHQRDWCLESIFCSGDASRIRELVYQLRNFDDVSRVKVMVLASE